MIDLNKVSCTQKSEYQLDKDLGLFTIKLKNDTTPTPFEYRSGDY